MKSYLSLIPISARIRRKQSKMTLMCIILAVFLVTAIFSIAETGLRMETAQSVDKAGYWHIALKGITDKDGAEIAGRPDVAVSSWYDVVNLDEHLNMDKDYYMEGAQTAICGIQEPFITDIMHYFSEGAQVNAMDAVILTENARELLGVDVGDSITLNTPGGDYDFVISGFRITGDGKYVSSNGGVTSALLVKDSQVGAFMNIDTFRRICEANKETGSPLYYVRFQRKADLKKSLEEIRAQYGLGDDDVELNTILMASKGISNKSYIQNVYSLAAVLFLLILAAGVLMISSSMNSNVAQRMQFFGMLRCIGASKSQIIRYVRLEALNWCRTAVPVGAGLGVIATWLISWGLKHLVGGEFSDMPVLTICPTGIVCGALTGVMTVLLAARVPARRAAKASPVTAASMGGDAQKRIRHGVRGGGGRIEMALGIHHAVSAKKNLFLMTGSFALSIILFFCFSVLIELVNCMMPQKLSSPDMDIATVDNGNSIDPSLADAIRGIDGVAHVFGRRVCFDVPAVIPGKTTGEAATQGKDGSGEEAERNSGSMPGETETKVDFMSYDDYQLELLVKDDDLRKGSDINRVYGDSGCVLAIWDRDMPLGIGDIIRVNGYELEIAGLLKYNPFTNSGGSDGIITIIASEETFMSITGIENYAILDVQLKNHGAGSSDAVEQIRRLAYGYVFRDRNDGDNERVFLAFTVFVYGFIGIISVIALLNIVNSISMSVSARINQYGAMRAVGMSAGQITGMIGAEAFTYGILGCALGCGVGLPLSKWMYDYLVTSHFYYFTWSVPVGQIVIVVVFIIGASWAAVYGPSKRIRDMAVTDAINEL